MLMLVVLVIAAADASAQRLIVRPARLLDVESGRLVQDAAVVVEGGRITRVGRRGEIAVAASDSVIDLPGHTLLPGLIDAHVHLAIGGPPRANAAADLMAGFTTIVDLGSRTTRLLVIRDSINAGQIPGPRVIAAGIWIGVQGGVCEFGGIGIAGSAEGFRARVRENVAAGAEVIKACVSGWPGAAFAQPESYEMPDSVLSAIVDEAGRSGRMVIAHDISLGGVGAAVRTGVRGLAHAAYVDSAAADAMKARGMFMISTLTTLAGDSSPGSLALVAATALAHRRGVPIVFGTDGGVLPHGQNAAEFAALMRAGLSPLDAIRSATITAARALGLDSLGVIAPGKVADLVAVPGNPLEDLAALQRPAFVISRGRVVRR